MTEIIFGGLISIVSIILGALLTYWFSIRTNKIQRNEKQLLELYGLMRRLSEVYGYFCMAEDTFIQTGDLKGSIIKHDIELSDLSKKIAKTLLLIDDKKLVGEIIDVLFSIDIKKYPTSSERRIRIFELTEACERKINRIYNTSIESTYLNNRKHSIDHFHNELEIGICRAPGHLSPVSIDDYLEMEERIEGSNVL